MTMAYTKDAPLRWGIIGPGSIAAKFAEGLSIVPEASVQAVASRSQEKSDAFGAKFGAKKCYASYEEMVNDPDVDAVYVATPHPFHAEQSLLALNAGKAVLCEKPFAVNCAQAESVIAVAREKKLFLMEGMWSRFFPLMGRVREIVASGAIGEVRMVQADFGFRAGVNPEGRLFNPALGGGSLLDVGIYPLSLASMFLGAPVHVAGFAQVGETGVDEQAVMSLAYDGGRLASLTTAIRTNTPHEAWVLGTDGWIKLHAPWWKLSAFTVSKGGQDEVVAEAFDGSGFNYEARHVAECLAGGLTESPLMPLDETLTLMRTMDTLRAQWGVRYPME